MPIYEYRCFKCGQTFDALQRINEEPLTRCIHCGGKVEKLVSATSFQFKGSGWYVTDYNRRKSSGDNGSKEKEAGKTDSQNVNKK